MRPQRVQPPSCVPGGQRSRPATRLRGPAQLGLTPSARPRAPTATLTSDARPEVPGIALHQAVEVGEPGYLQVGADIVPNVIHRSGNERPTGHRQGTGTKPGSLLGDGTLSWAPGPGRTGDIHSESPSGARNEVGAQGPPSLPAASAPLLPACMARVRRRPRPGEPQAGPQKAAGPWSPRRVPRQRGLGDSIQQGHTAPFQL